MAQSKVREGSSGGGKAGIPPDRQQKLNARWTTDVAAVTGYATYADFWHARGLLSQANT
jgi:hypothetical protein